jgi:hypothetical protein
VADHAVGVRIVDLDRVPVGAARPVRVALDRPHALGPAGERDHVVVGRVAAAGSRPPGPGLAANGARCRWTAPGRRRPQCTARPAPFVPAHPEWLARRVPLVDGQRGLHTRGGDQASPRVGGRHDQLSSEPLLGHLAVELVGGPAREVSVPVPGGQFRGETAREDPQCHLDVGTGHAPALEPQAAGTCHVQAAAGARQRGGGVGPGQQLRGDQVGPAPPHIEVVVRIGGGRRRGGGHGAQCGTSQAVGSRR